MVAPSRILKYVPFCHVPLLLCFASYLNIYTSNGVSLHELSVSLSKCREFSASESDDLCTICADGGDLVLCDVCPRAFHKGECFHLSLVFVSFYDEYYSSSSAHSFSGFTV